MEEKPKKRHGCLIGCLGVIVVFLLIGIVGAMFGLGSDSSETESDKSASKNTEQTQSTQDEKPKNNNSGTDSKKSSSKDTNPVKVSTPVVVPYKSSLHDYVQYAYYFSFENTGDTTVKISSFDIEVTDSEGVVLDQGLATDATVADAPVILQPGETGYCANIGSLNYDGSYTDTDIKVSAKANVKEAEGAKAALTCSDSEFVNKVGLISTVKTDKTIAVNVKNSSDEDFSTASVVVGLLDSSGDLIGVAYRIEGEIKAGQTVKVECDQIVLQDGKTMDDVDKIAARAAGLLEQGLF